MINLNELRDTSFEIAKSKGWHDADAPRATLGDRCALIISELSEALEEYRGGRDLNEIYFKGDGAGTESLMPGRLMPKALGLAESGRKPEGVPIELADVVIRIGDLAGRHELDLERVAWVEGLDARVLAGDLAVEMVGVDMDQHNFDGERFADWLMLATALTVDAWQSATADGRPSDATTSSLIRVVLVMYAAAKKFGFDLDAAIAIKHAFNKTRPFRHGGKKI